MHLLKPCAGLRANPRWQISAADCRKQAIYDFGGRQGLVCVPEVPKSFRMTNPSSTKRIICIGGQPPRKWLPLGHGPLSLRGKGTAGESARRRKAEPDQTCEMINTIGAEIIANTILGVPYYYNCSITGPKTLFLKLCRSGSKAT